MKKIFSKGMAVLMTFTMLTTAGCGLQNQAKHENLSDISPMIDQDGADPFVTNYGEKYLYTKTTGGNVCIAVADSIQSLGAAPLVSVYEPGAKLTDLWAPEIWQLDDVWYIYFAATIPGESIHRMFVLKNENENPLEGDWQIKLLGGMDDKFAIDGTIMELGDKRYFLWSGWEGDTNVRQDIYIAEMENPWTVKEEKILLSIPELAWEKNGNPLINEGPEVLVKGDTVNLVYSASGSWTDDYCLGLLTMPTTADPKEPSSWIKKDTPILSKEGDVYGPGHNSFVTTADGQDDLIIYHSARWKGSGWTRGVRYGYVTFDEKGELQKMNPVSGGDALPIPSGESDVTRYNASSLQLHGDLKKDSLGNAVKGFEYYEDYVSFDVKADEEMDAYLVVFASAAERGEGVITSLQLNCNDQTLARDLFGGCNYQPVFFPVHLNQGNNEVTIGSDMGGTEISISYIELRQ